MSANVGGGQRKACLVQGILYTVALRGTLLSVVAPATDSVALFILLIEG